MNNKIAILIPAYNAQNWIKELIDRIRIVNRSFTILVVDDGSSDNTATEALKQNVIVVNHKNNLGKGKALQTGFDYLKNQNDISMVITIDADLQHLPEEIPKLINKQKENDYDIVIGHRKTIGTSMPLSRKISNILTSFILSCKTKTKIKDSQCGFRLIKKSVIERIKIDSYGYEAETEFIIKSANKGYKIGFAPISTIYNANKSYMTYWQTTKNFIKTVLRSYE